MTTEMPAAGPWPRDDRHDRVYAIGDVHGCSALLDELCQLITADLSQSPAVDPLVCFLGDYIDRGPDSSGVMQRIAALTLGSGQHDFNKVIALRGNHEDRLLSFLDHPSDYGSDILRYGGEAAFASWGLTVPENSADWTAVRDDLISAIPSLQLRLLHSLLPAFEWRGHLFVHAGINPHKPLRRQVLRDLWWIRSAFAESPADHGLRVVHGHLEGELPVVRFNRVGVDTAAHRTGRLTCAVVDPTALRFLSTQSTG